MMLMTNDRVLSSFPLTVYGPTTCFMYSWACDCSRYTAPSVVEVGRAVVMHVRAPILFADASVAK